MERQAVWFTAPKTVQVGTETLTAAADETLVKTVCSAISPGTELLIYRGQAPQSLAADDTIEALAGDLAFPLKYGYAAVGQPANTDGYVFSFQPHQSHFAAAPTALMPVPDGIAPDDAVFLPNTETAVNFVHDGRPQLGERVLVLGAGVVGLLTTAILAQFPLASLCVIDPIVSRQARATALGATQVASSVQTLDQQDFDLVFELSGSPAVLNDAITAAGVGARIVIGSWYGAKSAPIDLGGAFHRNRLQLISSQVSSLTPSLLQRWDKQRRFDVAWTQIRRIQPSQLITHRLPIDAAARAYDLLDTAPQSALQVVFDY